MPRLTAVVPIDRALPRRPVHPTIAGETQVPLDHVRARLGPIAWAVWWEMLCCRSLDGGLFHGTTRRLAFKLEKPEHAVTHAIKRLRLSGLVRDCGKHKLEVYSGRAIVERTVYMRTVFGSVLDEHTLLVPEHVAAWCTQAHGHGGARPGTGPKSRYAPDAVFKLGGTGEPKNVHPSPSIELPSQTPPAIQVGGTQGRRPIQVGGSIHKEVGVDALEHQHFVLGARPAAEHTVFASLPRSRTDTGASIGAPRHAPPPITVGGPIPPYPGATLIPPAVVPQPPALPADATEYQLARALVDTYCAAVQARLGETCRILGSRKSLEGSRFYAGLVAAAQLLRAKKIAPAAWLAFWMDGRIRAGDRKRPPITVFFSVKFIDDHRKRWVFRSARPHYGGNAIFGQAHRALLVRYEDMRQTIRSTPVETLHDVERIVSEFFLPGEWALMLDAAQREAAATQVRLSSALASGDFIW